MQPGNQVGQTGVEPRHFVGSVGDPIQICLAALLQCLSRHGVDDDVTAAGAEGARLDAFYYCPHYNASPDPRYRAECRCRKPLPGLGYKAAADLGLDLRQSYMIGDKEDDVKFGRAIGATPVLVLTGYGRETREKIEGTAGRPEAVAADLDQAVDWILAREKSVGK